MMKIDDDVKMVRNVNDDNGSCEDITSKNVTRCCVRSLAPDQQRLILLLYVSK